LFVVRQEFFSGLPKPLKVACNPLLQLGDIHLQTLESCKHLIDLYESRNKPEEAEKWRIKLPQREAKTE
jgi:hypothetical protein